MTLPTTNEIRQANCEARVTLPLSDYLDLIRKAEGS